MRDKAIHSIETSKVRLLRGEISDPLRSHLPAIRMWQNAIQLFAGWRSRLLNASPASETVNSLS